MTKPTYILAIDQGTTSSRAILFDLTGRIAAVAQQELPQIYPQPGWVEHDPETIWADTVEVCRAVVAQITERADTEPDIAAVGLTNQRETTILWERKSGRAVHNAIVWQDRRTAPLCEDLIAAGKSELVTARTGLVIDAYFSASKLAWLLDHTEDGRGRARRGELLFGTVDSYLLWRLTGGRSHVTDPTNAARTMLWNIHEQDWDAELLDLFDIPPQLLPDVRDSAADFGRIKPALLGRNLPIAAVLGDQQAAAIGQGCIDPGMVKSTYGTGSFMLCNTGTIAVESRHQLLTTIAYRIGGKTSYALEGSIFVAGAAVQWLRDQLGTIATAGETEALAASVVDTRGVYLVPAFTGLGCPHWDPDARGALLGLTRDTGPAEIARAALEAVCYQTAELLAAMRADSGIMIEQLRADGGMAVNDWLLRFLADISAVPVQRPQVTETTALGAALAAGVQAGVFESLDAAAACWRPERLFEPTMTQDRRAALLAGWSRAVDTVRHHAAAGQKLC